MTHQERTANWLNALQQQVYTLVSKMTTSKVLNDNWDDNMNAAYNEALEIRDNINNMLYNLQNEDGSDE